MKQFFTLLLLVTLFTVNVKAQNSFQSPFRKGSYTRLGLNMMGNALDPSVSVKSNMLAGNFGGKMGAVLEKGRIFYFKSKETRSKVNYGLDWTIISVTYNPSKKAWDDYTAKAAVPKTTLTFPATLSLSSKLGPAVSLNVAEKLVIDLRAQVSAGAYLLGPVYENSAYSFAAAKNDSTAKIGDIVAVSIRPNFGITVRRNGIGLAFDYSPGKIKANYSETIGNKTTTGKADVVANNLQLKLSFTLKK